MLLVLAHTYLILWNVALYRHEIHSQFKLGRVYW